MSVRQNDRNALLIRSLQQELAKMQRDFLALKVGGSGSGSFNPQAQKTRIEDTINFSAYLNQDVKDSADVTFNSLTLSTPLADAQVADDITLTNITQITNRSHTNLSDIGSNSHPTIDTHLGSSSNPHTVAHSQLADKGANTHATIDTHLANEPSSSIATHAAIAAAHHTKYTDAEAVAAVQSYLLIGSGNAQYIPTSYFSGQSGNFINSNGGQLITSLSSIYFSYNLPLPSTLGSKSLHVTSINIPIFQADTNNKIIRVLLRGVYYAGYTAIYDSGTIALTSSQDYIQAVTDTDVSTYTHISVFILVTANATGIIVLNPRIKCYYT